MDVFLKCSGLGFPESVMIIIVLFPDKVASKDTSVIAFTSRYSISKILHSEPKYFTVYLSFHSVEEEHFVLLQRSLTLSKVWV
jgi:hypothetical protein